ncbi:6-bladed beta-propeller [Paludibacter sp. 221]|uniref:6-bladed beta-propeller n=1 Tax=Paludibacter sp. 221 TaxID=2302939 RepID=UPI0013D46C12|nr:6-bladed beta-propeller [Paludibacter sp. 221]NDV46519.1 6-bladed beta-propeller [Paludibacter sp. 221]
MRSFIITITTIFILFTGGCKKKRILENNAGNSHFVDLSSAKEISLFDIFSEIEIIPLETTNESIMNDHKLKIIPHDDYFYIMDKKQNSLFIFETTGKFIKKICKTGEGPGEYIVLEDFNINRFTGNLELFSTEGRIHIYDVLGDNFIETIYLPLAYVTYFENLDENIYIFYSSMQHEGSKFDFYSKKEDMILNLLKEDYNFPEHFRGSPIISHSQSPFYIYNNQLYFSQVFDGSILSFDMENKKINFCHQWDFGTHTFNLSYINKNFSASEQFDYLDNEGRKYATIFSPTFENSKYLKTSFNFNRRPYTIFYDKEEQNIQLINKFKERLYCFGDYMDEEYVYSIYPIQYLPYISETNFHKNNKKKLDLFSEDDNPFILRYKFK